MSIRFRCHPGLENWSSGSRAMSFQSGTNENHDFSLYPDQAPQKCSQDPQKAFSSPLTLIILSSHIYWELIMQKNQQKKFFFEKSGAPTMACLICL